MRDHTKSIQSYVQDASVIITCMFHGVVRTNVKQYRDAEEATQIWYISMLEYIKNAKFVEESSEL